MSNRPYVDSPRIAGAQRLIRRTSSQWNVQRLMIALADV
jgi:hypothetical protein